MAEQQSITIPAHHNIYNRTTGRELRLDFSIPTSGFNEDTGLLILVPGFGGNIDSNVYKKMRGIFADKYNLVTLQCSYFGDKYMQGAENFRLNNDVINLINNLDDSEKEEIKKDQSKLLQVLATKVDILPVAAIIDETENDFNDMGFMQAIDIITALEAIHILLEENNIVINKNKVIGYGHSHGAYLLHLSNRLAPHLFSHIVDNSAWMEPVYLTHNRYLLQQLNSMTLKIEFDYLAKQIVQDKQALNLETIYRDFTNVGKIISFQGTDDNLVDYHQKEKLVSSIPNAMFELINKERVDQNIFKSNTHGLNADFLKMFSFAYEKMGESLNTLEKSRRYDIQLSQTEIEIDYSYGLPVFNFHSIYK